MRLSTLFVILHYRVFKHILADQ